MPRASSSPASHSPAINLSEDTEIECPYCGEYFAIQVETEGGSYSTVEDCAVCCRPINLHIRCQPGEIIAIDVSID